MKKVIIALAIAGFMGVAVAAPAMACEDGKCTMAHKDDGPKGKKAKKGAAKAEECSMTAATPGAATPSCCMNKAAGAETSSTTTKPAKPTKAPR